MSRRLTNDEFLAKVAKLQPDVEVLDTYVTSSTRMRARCKRCGREWEADGGSLARGDGCIRCASVDREAKRRISTDEFRCKLSKISPTIEVIGEYKSSTDKIHVKCSVCGHEWLAAPYHLLEGHGCCECLREQKRIRFRSTHEEFVQKLLAVHPDFRVVEGNDNIYQSADTPLFFECPHGHTFRARPSNMLRPASGCPACKESTGEQRVRRYLEENDIPFIPQKVFSDCAYIRVLPFDFYVESLNTVIEFDGHHHFVPIKYFGGDAHLKETQMRDEIKTKYCLDNGITLIRIPYWDYDNIESILDEAISSQQRSQI